MIIRVERFQLLFILTRMLRSTQDVHQDGKLEASYVGPYIDSEKSGAAPLVDKINTKSIVERIQRKQIRGNRGAP